MDNASRARIRLVDVLVTAWETMIVALVVAFLVAGEPITLLAWESAAVLYLGVGLAVIGWGRRRRVPSRSSGAFGILSWVLPIVSSTAGVYSAVLALTHRPSTDGGATGSLAGFVVAAAVGMVLSWLLLHTGFAQIYQTSFDSHPDDPGPEFPATAEPQLIEFVYFAFAIGAAFATSDTRVLNRRMRRTVLIHSVIGFFYNAFVIAVAFQVLQQLLSR